MGHTSSITTYMSMDFSFLLNRFRIKIYTKLSFLVPVKFFFPPFLSLLVNSPADLCMYVFLDGYILYYALGNGVQVV